MEFKNFGKAIGTYLFTEILCLFLALTLSAIGGTILRMISCICTFGVMICLYINFAINRAKSDQRIKIDASLQRKLFLSSSAALPFLLWGIGLILARAAVLPGTFYRWYKLLDAPFLQLCNLLSVDVMAASLSWGQTIFLAACNLLPFVVVWISYTLGRKGVSLEELQYQHKR